LTWRDSDLIKLLVSWPVNHQRSDHLPVPDVPDVSDDLPRHACCFLL